MKSLLFALCFYLLYSGNSNAQAELEHKTYTTEYGRFDIWIYENQITGSYEIAQKKIIGSMWAELDGAKAAGRWTDPDGAGDIELTFQNGFQQFTADYRSDDEPDKWYRDQWHAKLIVARERTESQCTGSSYDLIQPFLGVWEEYELNDENQETFIGTLKVEFGAGGCSLVQRFASPDSSFFYSTQGYVNTGSGFWEEKYVFSTGSTADYQWIVDQGDVVQRRIGGTRRINHQHQLRFTELNESGYLLIEEQSIDGGLNWKATGRTRVKRKL